MIIVAPQSHIPRIESLLMRGHIRCKAIPNPPHISTSCGVCLVIADADYPAAHAILQPTPGLIFHWRESAA